MQVAFPSSDAPSRPPSDLRSVLESTLLVRFAVTPFGTEAVSLDDSPAINP